MVPEAVRAARERAQAAGVEVRFVEGDVTTLQAAGVGSGFRVVLDFGTVHGLARTQSEAVGREVTALAAHDATLLMYAAAPGHRGPLPRGLSHEEIEAAYPAWKTIADHPFDTEGMPGPFKKANPRWYRLSRR